MLSYVQPCTQLCTGHQETRGNAFKFIRTDRKQAAVWIRRQIGTWYRRPHAVSILPGSSGRSSQPLHSPASTAHRPTGKARTTGGWTGTTTSTTVRPCLMFISVASKAHRAAWLLLTAAAVAIAHHRCYFLARLYISNAHKNIHNPPKRRQPTSKHLRAALKKLNSFSELPEPV